MPSSIDNLDSLLRVGVSGGWNLPLVPSKVFDGVLVVAVFLDLAVFDGELLIEYGDSTLLESRPIFLGSIVAVLIGELLIVLSNSAAMAFTAPCVGLELERYKIGLLPPSKTLPPGDNLGLCKADSLRGTD